MATISKSGRLRVGTYPGALRGVFRRTFPQGRLLPEANWRRRHRLITVLLALHLAALIAFGTVAGYGLTNTLLETSVVFAALVVALLPFNRQLRAAAASIGFLTSSGVLVHFWGGSTEGAFHFFVVVALLTLYQDWVPFLIAILYVILHFGVIGSTYPTYVYSDPKAIAAPWTYAFIYAGFVAAMSIAGLVSWRANEQLLRDSLTGLPSRLVFLDRLTFSLLTRTKRGRRFAVIFFDLNKFKHINDTRGHAAGDLVLTITAQRVQGILRSEQTLARLGGDEFAILCPDITEASEAKALAERIQSIVKHPMAFDGRPLKVDASIGIALAKRHTKPDVLLAVADEAMYEAKRSRKGIVVAESA